MARELKIELIVDDKGTAHIKSFADGATDHLKKVEGAGKSMGDSFAKSWQGMAVGLNQGIQLFQQLAGAVQAPIEAYMQAEKAQLKMGMAMKNQGDFSKAALADMEEYAAQIQKTTAFEDDATLSIMANMKSYGMSNEQVKAATKAALDLATAKAGEGMTVERASEIMGKSYLGISTGLKKLGIQVDETKSKQELFNDVMGQVQDRFGGSAQAELLTYAGQWKQLKNQWGDIQEFLGLTFLKTIQAVQFGIGMVGAGFWKTAEMILDGWGRITGAMASVSKFIGLETIGNGLGEIAEGLKAGAVNAQEASDAATANASANYENMMSFDKVTDAIDRMGVAGKRTTGLFKEDEKTQKDILASLTAANKAHYEERVAASDHWLRMSKLGSYDDLATTAEVIENKKTYLNEWYDEQVRIIDQSGLKESEQTAKLTALWKEYNKTWTGLAHERELTAAQITKKGLDDAVDAMEKEIALGVKLTEDSIRRAKERGEAARDLYKDMRGYEQEYYDESITLINEQAERYRQLGLDQVAVAKWVAEETKRADYKKAQSSEDFFAGLKAAYTKDIDAQKTWGQMGIDVYNSIDQAKTGIIEKGVAAFLKGEDAKLAIQQAAGDAIVNLTGKYATEAFNAAIEKTISLIGAYIGEGAAASGAKASSGGAWAAVGEVGIYLGTAVAAMLGGRALAQQFRAEGGWIGTHPNGGFINQGSGSKDDVYLGQTGNTRHWGMGGEFVVNKRASQEYRDLLMAINYGHANVVSNTGYAEGGWVGSRGQQLVGDPDELALQMALGGELSFATSFAKAMGGGSDVYGAIASGIADTIIYIVSAMGGALGGKLLGNSFKAGGGEIRDMGHSFFGSMLDIFAPGVNQIIQITQGKNPTIPIFPGLLSLRTGSDLGNPLAAWSEWFEGMWKEFLNSQRAGWRNFADVILTPGDMSIDPMNGLVNELEHFGKHIVEVSKNLFELPGTVNEPAHWSMGGQIGSPLRPFSARRGLDYVPRDNFLVNTHEGEAVLNKGDAQAWRGGADSSELVAEIRSLRADIKAGNYAIARNTAKMAKILDRFDGDGMPAERVLS